MSSVTNLLRRLWSHRPVITTAQRIDDLADGRFVDGALWGFRYRDQQSSASAAVRP